MKIGDMAILVSRPAPGSDPIWAKRRETPSIVVGVPSPHGLDDWVHLLIPGDKPMTEVWSAQARDLAVTAVASWARVL
jgi:hypothetical protein